MFKCYLKTSAHFIIFRFHALESVLANASLNILVCLVKSLEKPSFRWLNMHSSSLAGEERTLAQAQTIHEQIFDRSPSFCSFIAKLHD